MEEGEVESDVSAGDEPMVETSDSMERPMEGSLPVAETSPTKPEGEPDDGVSEGKESARQVSNIRRFISPEEVQTIKSIYCSGMPEELNTKEKVKTYFAEFGEIVRIYMSFKKMACTIHFKDHKSAASAKKYGGVFGTKRFSIFWSQSSISKSSKSPTAIKKEEKKMEAVGQEEKAKGMAGATGGEAKMALRSFGRRKTSESSPSTSKVGEGVKPVKPTRSRGSKRKEKSDLASSLSTVDVVFSKHANVQDLQEVLKKPAKTSEEKYRVLEARDKLIRMEREKQQKKLGVSGRLHGTCPDMCPEKERYLRESQRQVHSYELKKTKEYSMNHFSAIKQYSRSSADQEEPLPHELRPPKVLMMTMNYMVCNIMDLSERKEENLRDWYFYVWDRTRAIRKDITQQQLCDIDSVLLVEQCARFHIHCAERLVSEDITVFDEKINNENLTKCLQTLKHLYHDLATKGEYCPNEAEFRGYVILMNLGDGNFMWEVQELRPEIQQSIPVRFAVQVYFALSSGNYVRFFNLVKSATYLNACLMHRYFNQVRTKALAALARSYSFPAKIAQFPVSDIVNLMQFESLQQGEMFCVHHGLEVDPSRKFLCLGRNTLPPASSVFPVTRAINVIESKRICSIGEVIVGGKISESLYQSHVPHNSFDEAGMLKGAAWNALDQEDSSANVDVPESVPTEPEVDREALLQEVSLPIVEEVIQETVVEEVKNVSREFLDYVNKLSLAFLSMYCETFVMDFVKDICGTTLRQMKSEKLQEEREAQELKKMYEDLINKMSEEAKSAILDEVVEATCKEEAISVLTEEREKESAVKEILSEMVDETVENMTEHVVKAIIRVEREERDKKLQSLAEAVKRVTLKHYLHIYMKSFEKKKQLKVAMQGFPAWISSMSLEEQVKWFGSSSHASEIGPVKRRWSTAFEHNFNASTQTYPLISVEDVINKSLLKSIARNGALRNELECTLRWNVVISLPRIWDGKIIDRSAAETWLNKCFTSEFMHNKQEKLLFQLERKIDNLLSLRVCLTRFIRNHHSQVGEPFCSVNGLLFIIQGCSNDLHDEALHLNQILVKNQKGNGCPLVILVIGMEKLSVKELSRRLKLDLLTHKKLISQYNIFSHSKNSGKLPHAQMEDALHWLAQNAEFPPPLDVQPLEAILEHLLMEDFWVSLHLGAQDSEILQLALQDPNDIISMYNASVELVAEASCSKNYLQLGDIPESQMDELNANYLCNYEPVISKWSSPSYLLGVKKLIGSLKLPKIQSLPAADLMELNVIMQDYFSLISLSPYKPTKEYSLVLKILEKELDFKSRKRNNRRTSHYSSPWPSVVKVMAGVHLRSVILCDQAKPKCPHNVIINKDLKKLLDSQDGNWWMKASDVPMLFEKIQSEMTQELTEPWSVGAEGSVQQQGQRNELWDLKESLEKLTSSLSKQSSQFAKLNSDIEKCVNSGYEQQ